ncbi:hypothetical protein B9T24_13280 [Acinetobacter sp. ANC 4654]|nr:hypothetical protein B9T24_13280 [Acinetobacter sp. ANC 4654]
MKAPFFAVLKAFCVLIVIMGLISCSQFNKIDLVITNQSKDDISSIVVKTGTDHKMFGVLKKGEKLTVAIVPKQASSLVIEVHTTKKIVTTKVDVYWEVGYKGEVNIKINDALQAEIVSQNIKI